MLGTTFNLSDIFNGSIISFLIVSGIIQVAPIPINPWSWIARAIGRSINADMREDLKFLQTEVTTLKISFEEKSAIDSRIRILRFGDELLYDQRHSKDHFDQILDDINKYEAYCEKHPDFRNNMTHMTVQQIKAEYAQCLKDNSFL